MSRGLFLVIVLAVSSGCAPQRPLERAPINAATVVELQEQIREQKAELDTFRLRGPFDTIVEKDKALRVSPKEQVNADVYLSSAADKGSLVIFAHGYDASKEAHANQALHLASWGFHCVVLQLPPHGPWDTNGRIIERVVRLLQRVPDAVDSRVDATRIMLVGHSFGASSVAVALAFGAPAAGAVLLDPAAIGRDLPALLRKIVKPVLVLGADDDVAPTRNREYFFHYIRTIAELSIRDASHEDAQYPSQTAVEHGNDPDTTEELQITFVAALTAAALSLSATGSFERAWANYAPSFTSDKFFNGRRK